MFGELDMLVPALRGNHSARDQNIPPHKYMFEINSRWSIDGSSRGNLARYINHACRPDAEFELMRGKLILYARKVLASGDQITCDYGYDYFDLFIAPICCRCATFAPK